MIIASATTAYDALQNALMKCPTLWKHDTEFKWHERTKLWQVHIIGEPHG